MAERAEQIIHGAAQMQGCTATLTTVSQFESHPNHQGFIDQLHHDLKAIGIPGECMRRAYQVPARFLA